MSLTYPHRVLNASLKSLSAKALRSALRFPITCGATLGPRPSRYAMIVLLSAIYIVWRGEEGGDVEVDDIWHKLQIAKTKCMRKKLFLQT